MAGRLDRVQAWQPEQQVQFFFLISNTKQKKQTGNGWRFVISKSPHVVHFLQQEYSSTVHPKSTPNPGPSIQISGPMTAGHILIQSTTSIKVELLIQQLLSADDLPLRLRIVLFCGDGDLSQTGESP